MKMNEIDNGAVDDAIDAVADSTTDDEPEGDRRQPARRAHHPGGECDGGDDGDADEQPAAEVGILLEQPVGDAAVPHQHEVEERRDPDRTGRLQRQVVEHPELGGEVDDEHQRRDADADLQMRADAAPRRAVHSAQAPAP